MMPMSPQVDAATQITTFKSYVALINDQSTGSKFIQLVALFKQAISFICMDSVQINLSTGPWMFKNVPNQLYPIWSLNLSTGQCGHS